MSSDIRLDDDTVTMEGPYIKIEGTDLKLDSPARRGTHTAGERRALVHDQRDGLTVNYDRDYPGGVTIRAVNTIEGDPNNPGCADSISVRSRVVNVYGTDIAVDGGPDRRQHDAHGNPVGGLRRALVHGPGDKLTLNYSGDYPGGVAIQGQVSLPAGDLNLGGAHIRSQSNGTQLRVECGVGLGGQLSLGDAWASIVVSNSAIEVNWHEQTGPASTTARNLELVAAILSLQDTVQKLEQRVSTLEEEATPAPNP
jgi:hypothetical protein